MDPLIISAIITLIGSAFVGIIGLRPSRNSTVPSLKEIRYQQLCLLFEPIEKLLASMDERDPVAVKNTVSEIHGMLFENHKLVPPFLHREVVELSKRHNILSTDLDDLRIMSSSLYNWHCRYLGYPYNSKRILRKYAPMYNRYVILKSIAERLATALVIMMILIAAMITMLMMSSS